MSIKSISTRDVAKITSGQVIIDLVSVVKELVENAIDASSDKIKVSFNSHGTVSVEVADNGRGIDSDDFASLALKHHTSKLTTFDDLSLVTTLGFRGEAMSSLCSVASVKISTCTASSFPRATELHFDSMGHLTSQKTVVSGKKGTVVTVSDLFLGMPVRQKNFVKNSKREYSRALTMLMAYLLAYTNIRFTVFNISGSTGKKAMTMGTQGGKMSTIDALVSVFGSNGAYGLVPIDIKSSNIDARFKLNMHSVPMSLTVRLSGYISDTSFGLGRGTGDRQFLTVNKRPVIHKRIAKVINEVYRMFNTTQFPVFVLDLEVNTAFVDVNVTPDKRMVLMQSEEVVLEVLREEMSEFFENRDNVVPKSVLGAVSLGSQAPKKRKFEENLGSGQHEIEVQEGEESERTEEENDKTHENEENDETQEKENEIDKTNDTESSDILVDAVETNFSEKDDTDQSRTENIGTSPQIQGKSDASVASKVRHIERAGLNEQIMEEFGQERDEVEMETSGVTENIEESSSEEEIPILQDVAIKPDFRSTISDSQIDRNNSLDAGRIVSQIAASGEKEGDMHEHDRQAESSALSDVEVCEKHEIACMCKNSSDIGPRADLVRDRTRAEHDHALDRPISAQDTVSEGDNDDVDRFEDLQDTAVDNLFVNEGDDEEFPDGESRAATRGCSEATQTHSRLRLRKHGTPQLMHDVDAATGNNAEPAGLLPRSRSDRLPGQLYRHQYRLELKIPQVIDSWEIGNDVHRSKLQRNNAGVRAAIHDLTRALEIKKSDFQHMQVVGQFNLGFIIVGHLGKLFIVDQHALDEIYNYEKLMRSLVLRAQPLVVPRTLELSAVDEMVMLEHLGQLRKNGFIVEEDPDAPPGLRAKLVAVPVLKNVTFDDTDLHELVHKLHNHGSPASQTQAQRIRQTVRCTKVDGMIALRACRLSIMVGQSLGKNTMTTVVKQLATLDRPWNCPHGRPTMRHLVDLEGDLYGEDYEV